MLPSDEISVIRLISLAFNASRLIIHDPSALFDLDPSVYAAAVLLIERYCQEPMSMSMQLNVYSCHGVFTDRFIFRSNLL